MSELRDAVAAELVEYLAAIGLADPWSDDRSSSTRWRYSDDGELYEPDRLDLHSRLIDDELAKRPASRRPALGVVVTAGPPGSGKSTVLAADPELSGYRPVDADAFKDALLLDQRARLAPHLEHRLADGRPVALRELASFVHAESTTVANAMRDRCFSARENVVVFGTLSSAEQTRELLQQLDEYGYSRLVIVDVEVGAARATERALERWWTDRLRDADGLGGRFVPPSVIDQQYRDGTSLCSLNALDLKTQAELAGWSVELRHMS